MERIHEASDHAECLVYSFRKLRPIGEATEQSITDARQCVKNLLQILPILDADLAKLPRGRWEVK